MKHEPSAAERRLLPHSVLASVLAEVTARGESFRFEAGGRSMWPFVHDGDTLVVEALGGRPPSRGDILVYRTPHGGVAAHRLVGFEGTRLRVRGDRLRAPLEIVEPGEVLGRVGSLERHGRRRSLAWRRRLARVWIGVREVLRAGRRIAGTRGRTATGL